MDLHGVVSGQIAAVNPPVLAELHQSVGYTTNPDGSRQSAYAITSAYLQIQALSASELEHVNSLNISGLKRKIYLSGNQWSSVVRGSLRGGDYFVVGSDTWLVIQVTETWPDWTSVAVVLQVPASAPTASSFTVDSAVVATTTADHGSRTDNISVTTTNLVGPITVVAVPITGDTATTTVTASGLASGTGTVSVPVVSSFSGLTAPVTAFRLDVTIGGMTHSTEYILEYATVTPVPPAPTVTGFSPASGSQGTFVTVTGTGFTGASGVSFGVLAAPFEAVSDTELVAAVPAIVADCLISVTTPGGTGSPASTFVYAPPAVVGDFQVRPRFGGDVIVSSAIGGSGTHSDRIYFDVTGLSGPVSFTLVVMSYEPANGTLSLSIDPLTVSGTGTYFTTIHETFASMLLNVPPIAYEIVATIGSLTRRLGFTFSVQGG